MPPLYALVIALFAVASTSAAQDGWIPVAPHPGNRDALGGEGDSLGAWLHGPSARRTSENVVSLWIQRPFRSLGEDFIAVSLGDYDCVRRTHRMIMVEFYTPEAEYKSSHTFPASERNWRPLVARDSMLLRNACVELRPVFPRGEPMVQWRDVAPSRWYFVTVNVSDDTIYIDRQTIRRSASKVVSAWIKTVYAKPDSTNWGLTFPPR